MPVVKVGIGHGRRGRGRSHQGCFTLAASQGSGHVVVSAGRTKHENLRRANPTPATIYLPSSQGVADPRQPLLFFEKVQKGPEFLPTGRYSPKEIRPLRMSRTAVRDESLWFRFLTTVRGDGQEFFFAVPSQFGGLCRRVAESPEKIKIRKNHGRKKQQRVLPGSGFGL